MAYITQEGLKNLKNYKYQSGGYTWLDKKFAWFYEHVVKFLPKYLAPNVMTLSGWLLMCISVINILAHDLTFENEIPRWCFFFTAFCIFCFMNLDIVDGVQARKYGGGSPLGQLIDHGCDSFTMTSLMLGVCEALLIDKDSVFVIFVVTQLAFWTFNWVENHTGVLNTNVGNIGVVEGQLLCMTIHILTGIYGQQMWKVTPMNYLPHNIKRLIMQNETLTKLFSVDLGTSLTYAGAIIVLFFTIKMFLDTLPKCKSKSSAVGQYLSSFLILIMEIVWSQTVLFDEYCGLILVNFGILASFILCKLIICNVTKMEVDSFHWHLLPTIAATFILIFLDSVEGEVWKFKVVFWACLIINIVSVFGFIILTINQITSFLGIKCLTVKKKK